MTPSEAYSTGGTIVDNSEHHFHFYDDTNRQMAFEQTGVQPVDDIEVGPAMTGLWINSLIFLLLMGSYEFFLRAIPSVYAGRQKHVDSDRMPVQIPPSYLPFGWVLPVARIPWNEVLKASGLDAYMFLRYIRMCFIITSVSGFWGIIVLFPTYAAAGGGAKGWYFLSMANIIQGSWRLWIPCIFMWLMTFFVFYLMNEEYKHYFELRMEFMAGTHREVDMNAKNQYSLMVDYIPHHLRSDRALFNHFNKLFPGEVHSATVVMNIPDLEARCTRRERVVCRLEKSIALHEATGKRAKHVVGRKRIKCCGIESFPINPLRGRRDYSEDYEGRLPQRGEKVDSINYYTRDLVDMNDKILELQKEKRQIAEMGNEKLSATERIADTIEQFKKDGLLLGFREGNMNICGFIIRITMGFIFGGLSLLDHTLDVVVDSVERNDMSSHGYITFKSLSSVTCAASIRVSTANTLSVSLAPESRDIMWKNVHIDSTIIKGREFTANFLLLLGVIFWSVPVASIQSLANLEGSSKIPGMGWMLEFDGGILRGYIPVLLLLGLINLLPFIFEMIAVQYENRKTHSDIQNSIFQRFFYYQLANIYITVTAASLWDSLADILERPSDALKLLGQTLPTVVGYFIALLITKVLAGLPLVLLRLGALSRMLFIKLCFREKMMTQRELDEVYKRQSLFYGWEYPTQLLVVIICFTYTCISPTILPVGAIYFLFALIVYKKQCLVVYCPTYEGGGLMFCSVCQSTLIGLICAQITLAGYMLIRGGIYQLVFLLPLPVITVHMMNIFNSFYAVPSRLLSLERAKELDSIIKENDEASSRIQLNEDLYRQPSLTAPKAEPLPYRRDISDSSMLHSHLKPQHSMMSVNLDEGNRYLNVGKIV